MWKLVVAIVLLGVSVQVNAGGWRELRIDGTSKSTFEKSVAEFQRNLPPERRAYFEVALQEIWSAVGFSLGADGADQAVDVYFKRLDGLRYREIIRVGGPEARKTYLALFPGQTKMSPTALSIMVANGGSAP
jgi:hypothetical protein